MSTNRCRSWASVASPKPQESSISMKILPVLLFQIALVVRSRVRATCVNLTSSVDGAGDPGPGSAACLPYSVDVSALAGTVSIPEASMATAAVAPAIDVSVVVDESGSVKTLCRGTLDCYDDERQFAMELVTLLDAEVGLFGKGGTALYMEYSSTVNVNEAFSARADYLAFVEAQTHLGGGTYIGTAIAEAREALLALPGREDRSQIMVVMTDGHEGGNTDPAGEAALAAEAGITMYVVAVDVTGAASPTCDDSDFWPSCIDGATMLQVAGAPERLFVVDTFESLTDAVLHDVLAGIGIPCATGATLSLQLDKAPIAVPAVSSGEVEVSYNTVTWTMDSVGDSASLTFVVDYCQCESQRATVDFIASAAYTDDEANEPNLLGLLNLTAQATELCPTPGPSSAPTLSPTIPPTISPTPGATNSALPTPFFPTPAPQPLSNIAGRDSGTPWYERLSIVLPSSAALGAVVVVWAIAKGFCCCFGRKAAVGPGEKKKVKCPACGQSVWVAYVSLQNEARCSCDALREEAEAGARGGRTRTRWGAEGARGHVMSEGFNKRVLSRLDPEHASTCVHCRTSFCTPCDVRDNKRAFLFLRENNPERKEGQTRAARRSTLEAGKAKQMWSFLRGQKKRIREEPGPPAATKREDFEVQKNSGAEDGQERGGGGRESAARQEEEKDNARERGGERDREKGGPRGPSMADIVVQRPPVPFSNGPYPEVLPSGLSGQQRPGEKQERAPARKAAGGDQGNRRDHEDEGKGRKAEERREESRGSDEERPGRRWSNIWSSFGAAINARK